MLLKIYVKYIKLSVSGKVSIFRSDFENLLENGLPEYLGVSNTSLLSKNNFTEIFPYPFFLHLNDTE